MRILHLNALYPPEGLGGAEQSVCILAEQTAFLGHEVAVACISREGEDPTVRNGVRVFRMAHGNLFWLEDWAKYSPGGRRRQKFAQQFNNQIGSRFEQIIRAFEPDLVHSHSLVDVSTTTWRAARREGVPIVHTLRDFDLVCSNSSMVRNGTPCSRRHLECRVLTFRKSIDQTCVTAVTGVGTQILDTHLQFGFFRHVPPGLRRVIWNPIVQPEASSERTGLDRRSRSGPLVFGYLGRLSPEKGIGTLLDACRLLPAEGWTLRVAGKGADGSLLQVGPLASKIEFFGHSEPLPFLRSIDVLVVPSIWNEPFGRVIPEAFAAGVPVLGSMAGAIPEMVGPQNRDWLFRTGDSGELAARMQWLIREGRGALPTQGSFARVLGRTRPDVVTDEYLALYRDVLTHGAVGPRIQRGND